MKKPYFIFATLIATLIASHCFSQSNRKLSAFFSFQVNKALYDRTITNNSNGVGFGLQTYLNTKTLVKATAEVNADLFVGTKELYVTADRKPIDAKSGVISIYAGPSFQPTKTVFITATVGSSFYNSKAHFGVRPSIGIYPSKSNKWAAKASFTNVFQLDEISNESFGYFSFALALKLF